MVKFQLIKNSNSQLIYEYYPEADYLSKPGIIVVNEEDESIYIETVAEKDFLHHTSLKSLNEMRDTINKMRKENGEVPLTESELPSAKNDESWYYYANHVIRKLNALLDTGEKPNKGTVVWY